MAGADAACIRAKFKEIVPEYQYQAPRSEPANGAWEDTARPAFESPAGANPVVVTPRRSALLGEHGQLFGAAANVLRGAHDTLRQPVAAALAEADLAQELGKRILVVPLEVQPVQVAPAIEDAAVDAFQHPAQQPARLVEVDRVAIGQIGQSSVERSDPGWSGSSFSKPPSRALCGAPATVPRDGRGLREKGA